MATIQDQIAQAKAAGYSDVDIAQHLSQKPEFAAKFKTATDAGYKPSEIISHLSDAPRPSLMDEIKQGAGNFTSGLVRGAGSIGSTLLLPVDMAKDAIDGKGLSLESNRQRRADIDAGLQTMGAQPDSMLYKSGKLAGEVAGTAGVGGALANGARAVGVAPELVSAIGSGGMTGGGSALTRAAGGSITGAGSAGLVDPKTAGTGALIGGALPGATQLAGKAGNALFNAAQNGSQALANRLMQSAIKPTIAQRQSGEADTAIKTLLEYGISPTKSGVNKLQALIDDLNTQISDKIGNSTATVDKQKVLDALDPLRAKFASQVSPTKDLGAIQSVADDFAAHPSLQGAQIPVQQAQEMKQGTYRVLNGKFGEAGSAETEAQKGLARGLKDEIATVVPGVGPLNAEESKLLTTLKVSERRALLEANKNTMGLASLANNPLSWAAFMADRSSAFKALAARMVANSVPAVGAVGQGVLGVASNPLVRTAGVEAISARP